jgi:adenylate kinase family enzyme
VDEGAPNTPLIGERISVVGVSSTGKSTLAEQLADLVGGAFVELDALFWLPQRQESTAEDFQAKVTSALDVADRWAVAGTYTSRGIPDIVLPRADTLIWLDLPLRTTMPRLIRRTWRRWRDNELLWGTNRERITEHLKLWSNDSLVGYSLRHNRETRRRQAARFADPRWQHLKRHRLRSAAEVRQFLSRVEREAALR